jgi:hypothetical protein
MPMHMFREMRLDTVPDKQNAKRAKRKTQKGDTKRQKAKRGQVMKYPTVPPPNPKTQKRKTGTQNGDRL